MEPFRRLTGIAAPLPVANIDTDMILSAAFLKTVSRAGLGRGLFHAWRFDGDGAERPDFVLNREPWRRAAILITLDNFGCGSSREHAPWALLDFGVRCVIAPSFADIFYGNCFKNGILPIRLGRPDADLLMQDARDPRTATLAIDLEAQTITRQGGALTFDIDAQRRERLLNGMDDIADALRFGAAIAAHEETVRADRPWLADARLARTDAG
jgi:3-isopropylmalate/(R)-2-methylmalate dehydratase small subunit